MMDNQSSHPQAKAPTDTQAEKKQELLATQDKTAELILLPKGEQISTYLNGARVDIVLESADLPEREQFRGRFHVMINKEEGKINIFINPRFYARPGFIARFTFNETSLNPKKDAIVIIVAAVFQEAALVIMTDNEKMTTRISEIPYLPDEHYTL